MQCIKPSDEAQLRLFAFPHAGASTSAYREWDLPPLFELWAYQPAGRGSRFSEPAASNLHELVDSVVDALRPTLDAGVPVAFFGHSFGCLVAVEVARRLADLGLPTPLTLLLSAHPAPGVALDGAQATLSQSRTDEVRTHATPARTRTLPRLTLLVRASPGRSPSLLVQELLEGLRLWDFAPETLDAGDAELLKLTVPPIRADLAMREAYCADAVANEASGAPRPARLRMPLHVFGGAADRSCPHALLAKWALLAPTSLPETDASNPTADAAAAAAAAEAEGPFSLTTLPGGHFYLEQPEARAALQAHVVARLEASVRRLRPSIVLGPSLPPMASLTYAHEMVESVARRCPDKIAIIGTDGTPLSYRTLIEEATKLGGWLVAHGAKPGQTIALLMGHCAEYAAAFPRPSPSPCLTPRHPPLSAALP